MKKGQDNMLIELCKIRKKVKNGSNHKDILKDLDLEVYPGDYIAIKGRSGSGKSTLLNILGGLISFDEGEMFFEEKNITKTSLNEKSKYRKEHIGFITQQFNLLDDRNVFENIALPLQYNKVPPKEIKELVKSTLHELEMEDFIYKPITNLSGGEKQRIAIARALVKKPSIILADEPTGSLDEKTEEGILNIFDNLQKQGITIIIVTHSNEVASHCKYIYQLEKGSLKKVFYNPITKKP